MYFSDLTLRLLILSLFLLFAASAWAADAGVSPVLPNREKIPQEFWYNGNPIDASLVDSIGDSSRFDPRPLNQNPPFLEDHYALCSNSEQGCNQSAEEEGFYGYTYINKESAFESPSYEYYKYLGKWHGLHITWAENGGGGSGSFSELSGWERKGDVIQLKKEIASGDRCTGGIVDAGIDNDHISYSVHITQNAFVRAFVQNKKLAESIALGGGLEDGAISCFAIAHYRDDAVTGVDIPAENLKPSEDDKATYAAYPKQACFDKLIRKAAGGKDFALTAEDAGALVQNFLKVCMK